MPTRLRFLVILENLIRLSVCIALGHMTARLHLNTLEFYKPQQVLNDSLVTESFKYTLKQGPPHGSRLLSEVKSTVFNNPKSSNP